MNDHDVSPHSEQDQDSENDSDPETKLNNDDSPHDTLSEMSVISFKQEVYLCDSQKLMLRKKNTLTYLIKRYLFIHRITFEPDYILCPHPRNMGLCHLGQATLTSKAETQLK